MTKRTTKHEAGKVGSMVVADNNRSGLLVIQGDIKPGELMVRPRAAKLIRPKPAKLIRPSVKVIEKKVEPIRVTVTMNEPPKPKKLRVLATMTKQAKAKPIVVRAILSGVD